MLLAGMKVTEREREKAKKFEERDRARIEREIERTQK